MARARNIKPGYFKNEVLAECQPLARILFAGLWCIADKDGRLEDRPKRIKSEVLCYDDCDINGLLDELACKGFIVRYMVEGVCCIQIVNFGKHQSPHKGEVAYDLPSLDDDGVIVVAEKSHEVSRNSSPSPSSLIASSLIPSSLNDVSLDSSEPQTASEPKEEESPPFLTFPVVGTKGTEWTLTIAKADEYRQAFPGIDVETECRKALQWCRDNPSKRKTPAGMAKFLGGWMSRAQDNAARPNQNRSPPVQANDIEHKKRLLGIPP